jgi:hypothetical protein
MQAKVVLPSPVIQRYSIIYLCTRDISQQLDCWVSVTVLTIAQRMHVDMRSERTYKCGVLVRFSELGNSKNGVTQKE